MRTEDMPQRAASAEDGNALCQRERTAQRRTRVQKSGPPGTNRGLIHV